MRLAASCETSLNAAWKPPANRLQLQVQRQLQSGGHLGLL
jgi:hypothetical protein